MKRIVSSIFVGLCLLASMPAFANIAEGVSGSCKWVIDNDGNLDISSEDEYEEGVLGSWEGDSAPWSAYRESITTVAFSSSVQAVTCTNMFNGCTNLNSIYFDNFYTDNVTDMSNMFANCTSLVNIEFGMAAHYADDDHSCYTKGMGFQRSVFNTYNVADMSGMFAGCKSLQSFNILAIDMRMVSDFSNMFADCISLESLDLSSLAIMKDAKVDNMFKNCNNLMNIVNQNTLPASIEDETFLSLPTRGLCAVEVPFDCLEDYEAANGWRHLFSNGNSAAFQSTAISSISSKDKSTVVYAISGSQLPSPSKGINIVAGKKVVMK